MSLIRYQTPSSVMWPSLNRWASLRDDLDTLLELPFLSGGARQEQLFTGWTPALDLYQNNDNVVAVGNGESATRTERFTGKFRRSITLPTRVDANKVNATYKDGVLTVTLPKAEEAKPKQIQVNVS